MKAMATNQTVSWFCDRLKEDSLQLSADFQRNPVWLQPQKNYLIETILLRLPVPEVYVVNRVTPKGESEWIVVDGQQRLRTILGFVTGELTVSIDDSRFRHIKKFDDLTDGEKTQLWRYPIVVRDLEDSGDEDVRDLFQRLNKYSVNLNEQELRNARFKGEFLAAVEMLGELEFWTTSGVFSANDIRRMLDLEFIGVLLSTMIGGVYNRKDRLDEFYEMYEFEFDEKNNHVSRFNRNLSIIDNLLPEIKRTRWKNKAEFYTLFLLIDSLQPSLADPEGQRKLANQLTAFHDELLKAREDPQDARPEYIEYLEAATYGTNDKEKRVRRLRILKDYIAGVASETNSAGE